MGLRIGCQGVDNAKLFFHSVEVPKESLLNKYSDMSHGKLVSSIKQKRARFLAVADRLLSGRMCIASMSLGGTKKVLTIGLK